MAPNGASLKQFNSVINRKEPNPLDMTTIKGTRQDSVSVFNAPYTTYNGMPKVNWNGYNTTDSILNPYLCNTASTSSSSSSDTPWYVTLMGVMTGATMALGLVTSVKGLIDSFKSDKSSKAESASDSHLASLVDEADNVDKNTSKTELQNISQNLMTQKGNAERSLAAAKQTLNTAQSTLTRISGEKNDWETKLSTFDTDKGILEGEISNLQSQIDALPADDPQGKELTEQLNEKKKELKEKYSDSKRKTITNQIDRLDKEFKEWSLRKAEAKDKVDNLPSEIKSAEKAIEKLNKRINN